MPKISESMTTEMTAAYEKWKLVHQWWNSHAILHEAVVVDKQRDKYASYNHVIIS